MRRQAFLVLSAAATLFGACVALAIPAYAATMSPSALYYPSGASCASGAPGGKWADASGNPISSLTGSNGDQVTIINQCSADIYVFYGGGPTGSRVAGAVGGVAGTATFTVTSTTVAARDYADYFAAGSVQLASVTLSPPLDVVTAGSNTATTLTPSNLPVDKTSFQMQNGGSDPLTIVGPISFLGLACNPCSLNPGQTKTFTVNGSGGTVQVGSASLGVGSSGGGGTGDTGGAASTDLPSPVIQQFGMPTSGMCDASASASLNWAGVPSGGWSVSWSEWMNGGKGGAVCTRTLVYSTDHTKWMVAA